MDTHTEHTAVPTHETSPQGVPKSGFFRETAKAVFLILLIVIPVRMYIISPFIVSGESMLPTFESSDYLIVDKFSYRFTDPQRGDVIVFKYPGDPSVSFIKRVIGLPGETVSLKDGAVTIKESPDDTTGLTLSEPYITYPKEDTMTVTLGEDDYFVMGDNRYASSDSRVWGTLNERFLQGKVMLRLFPVSHAAWLPGEMNY